MAKARAVSETITCMLCGKEKSINNNTNNWYNVSPSSIYRNAPYGKVPLCKKCLKDRFTEYYSKSSNTKWSVYKMCEKLDIPFFESTYSGALGRTDATDWQPIFGYYMTMYNSFASKNGWDYSFDSSDRLDMDYSENGEKAIVNKKTKLVSKDKSARDEIIDLLGYDPFDNYSIDDKKRLYPIFRGYLNEDSIEDGYLISVFTQLCSNNAQVEKYSEIISKLNSDGESILQNAGDIKTLNALIKDINMTSDKLAKENGISLIAKKKTSSGNNKTALSGIMKELTDYNFDEIEIDYYDQMKAYGMKRTADISFKSIMEQCKFGENAIDDMIAEQRELVSFLQEEVLKLKEKSRIYYLELKNLNVDVDSLFKDDDTVDVQDFYDPSDIPEEYVNEYGGEEEDDVFYLEDKKTKAEEVILTGDSDD